MKYLKQVSIVTFWEYRRFYKPKNEALGLVIMLLVSIVFYYGGKYALSEKNEKSNLTITQNSDSLLIGLLSGNFNVVIIPLEDKDVIIAQIAQKKRRNSACSARTRFYYTRLQEIQNFQDIKVES